MAWVSYKSRVVRDKNSQKRVGKYWVGCTSPTGWYTYRIANLISKLNFYKLIPYPMDWQGPPIQPRYQPTRGLHSTRQQKRCYDVMLSGQK